MFYLVNTLSQSAIAELFVIACSRYQSDVSVYYDVYILFIEHCVF